MSKKASFFDIFRKSIKNVPDFIKDERMAICINCPLFLKMTGQCKECGCFMNLKTKLPHANCPLHKWEEYKEN